MNTEEAQPAGAAPPVDGRLSSLLPAHMRAHTPGATAEAKGKRKREKPDQRVQLPPATVVALRARSQTARDAKAGGDHITHSVKNNTSGRNSSWRRSPPSARARKPQWARRREVVAGRLAAGRFAVGRVVADLSLRDVLFEGSALEGLSLESLLLERSSLKGVPQASFVAGKFVAGKLSV